METPIRKKPRTTNKKHFLRRLSWKRIIDMITAGIRLVSIAYDLFR